MKRLCWKRTLLVLATSTTLALGFQGCLQSTIQRVLVGVLV